MTMIVDLLLHRLKTQLTAAMIDNVDPSDVTRAGIVKIGRFQDSPLPLDNGTFISISGGDQQDPELADGVLDVRAASPGWQPGFWMASREVGGSAEPGEEGHGNAMWWRRGRIQIGCFYINEQLEEEVAATAAYETLGRLTYAIDHCPVHGLKDSYGELAVKMFAFASNFFESGGPPKQYIWRGSVKWQCLTERSR